MFHFNSQIYTLIYDLVNGDFHWSLFFFLCLLAFPVINCNWMEKTKGKMYILLVLVNFFLWLLIDSEQCRYNNVLYFIISGFFFSFSFSPYSINAGGLCNWWIIKHVQWQPTRVSINQFYFHFISSNAIFFFEKTNKS